MRSARHLPSKIEILEILTEFSKPILAEETGGRFIEKLELCASQDGSIPSTPAKQKSGNRYFGMKWRTKLEHFNRPRSS